MLSVKGDLYPCIQYSGCGLFRYLICFATHTLVNQCQFLSKKVLSHFSILININRFHPYFNYSPFFLINSSIFYHLITLQAYLRSTTLPHLYYRGCWHRLWPGHKKVYHSFCNSLRILFPSSTGSNFRSLPNIPHCCHRKRLFSFFPVIIAFSFLFFATLTFIDSLWLSLRIISMKFFLHSIYLNLLIHFPIFVKNIYFILNFLLGKLIFLLTSSQILVPFQFTSMCHVNE